MKKNNAYTGNMVQRPGGLGNLVDDLEFSPNGYYLSSALHASPGVVIYRTSKKRIFTTFKTLSG